MQTYDWKSMHDTKSLAKLLGYTIANVTRLARTGKIPYVRRGNKMYFQKDVVRLIVKEEDVTCLK